jgi:uncharacterized protein
MLLIEISTIPPEGLVIDEALDPASVHVAGEETFALQAEGRLSCRLERVDGESVHVRGELQAALDLECNRCLATYALPVHQDLDLFYLPHRPEAEGEEEEDEVELGDHDLVVAYHDGTRLDLGEMVREQIFLSVPMKRLCRQDCKGRCPSCGADLNTKPCGCPAPEAEEDPRLAPLKKLFSRGPDQE